NTTPFAVNVLVTDADGSTGTTSFTVVIDDDTPLLHAVDSLIVQNVQAVYTGDWSYTAGADGLSTTNGIDAMLLTPLPSTVEERADLFASDGSYIGEMLTIKVGGQEFFNLFVSVDGTYQFNLVTPNPSTSESQNLASNLPGVSDGLWLEQIVDSKIVGNFDLFTDILFTTTSGSGGNAGVVNSSSNGIGVGNQHIGNGDNLMLRFFDSDDDSNGSTHPTARKQLTQIDLSFAFVGGASLTNFSIQFLDQNNNVIDLPDNLTDSITASINGSNSTILLEAATYGIDGFYGVQLVHTGGSLVRLNGTTTHSSVLPDDQELDFGLTIYDGDGDMATSAFSVTISAEEGVVGSPAGKFLVGSDSMDTLLGGGGNDLLFGQGGDDILIGGLGNDTLTGGGGSDTFKWLSGESGVDTVTDFVAGYNSGGDRLDLSELLIGEDGDGGPDGIGNLLNYIDISTGNLVGTAAPDTVIKVDASGGGDFASPDQTIVLQDVDLFAAYGPGATESSVILGMLGDGTLKVDTV
ncbi:type I secretion C-terminal target domain-containing protein, partial [Pseudomonas sp. NPDC077649]|uniref:type I secretion C-terminal target domain-containing protein n=1 Tax=Pseudomonas sp. NPDC077649 TaxID=3364423 RepID=UPI0037C5BF89